MAIAAAQSELMSEPHEARLLVLLAAAGKKSGKPVRGLTKLAKLDFLLRYPNCLERALQAVGKDPKKANIQAHERTSIEAKMVRFRYGPWDHRYRRWLSLLQARGLAEVELVGRTVCIGLTDEGRELAAEILTREVFSDLAERSRLLARTFGEFSGTKLKDFIYETFPEVGGMPWGEEIKL